MSAQPEALRIADECEQSGIEWRAEVHTRLQAAAELRRLHARIEVLEHYRKVYGQVSGILAYTAEVGPIEPGDEITVRRLKMLVADLHTYVQRCQAKDALLRQALEALETDAWQKKLQAAIDIKRHLENGS
jgi:MOSC domain-containing protein YiiM